MSYIDIFDEDEFELFRKFNNGNERQSRHIDVYYVEDDIETDKINYNRQKSRESLRVQKAGLLTNERTKNNC